MDQSYALNALENKSIIIITTIMKKTFSLSTKL